MNKTLSSVIDFVNESTFYNRTIPASEAKRIVSFISDRQGKPGAYAHTFAPVGNEMEHYRLYTGETPAPRSASHILGEESCRALIILGKNSRQASTALSVASRSLQEVLEGCEKQVQLIFPRVFFCCPKCTCGLWRHLAVGGLKKSEHRLSRGLAALKTYRDGKGGWSGFPFHYTLLALSEMRLAAAKKELEYSAGRCEKEAAGKAVSISVYSKRRHDLVSRVLEIV